MSGERTEAATPRRLHEMRGQGRVARSQDLVSAIALLGGVVVLQATAQTTTTHLQVLMTGMLQDLGAGARIAADPPGAEALWVQTIVGRAAQEALLAIAPAALLLPALAILASIAQGPVMSGKALFSPDRVNPLSGFKRLFSAHSLVEMVRSLAKLGVVTWVVVRAIQDSAERLPQVASSTDARAIAEFVGGAAASVGMAGAQGLFVLAILDLAYQRWSFARGARMTKQEVKEEYKQQEGDPLLKARVRALQRKMATARRQLLDVPTATVVVTNPTHLAVALKYDRTMGSPRVVAKGADLVARQIREIAQAAGVPVIEDKPLARGLYKLAEAGDDIPLELYEAVAAVLAHVFSLKKRRRLYPPAPGNGQGGTPWQ